MSTTCQLQLSVIRAFRKQQARLVFVLQIAVLLVSAGVAAPARAQTPSPLAEWQYSAGVPLSKLFEAQPPQWRISMGAAAAVQPLYPGAQHYHVRIGPSIDVRYRDLYFISTGEGAGVNLLRGPNWRAGVAITYDLGRRAADDYAHLSGMGNINPAPALKLYGEYVVSKDFPLVVRADVRRSVGGANGWIGDLGAYLPLPGSSEKFYWFAGPNLTFADGRYMNSWFGVNQAQAARSGYPAYHANAGLRSAGAGVSAVWFVQKHWFLTADAALAQLVGSAAHSPVTQKSTDLTADLSVNYQF